MKIILILFSAVAACISGFLTLFYFLMLNGGGLGQTTVEEVLIVATYTLLNLAVIVSVLNVNTLWHPVFYILGIIDFFLGVCVIYPKYDTLSVLLGLVICLKGCLAIIYASGVAPTYFPSSNKRIEDENVS